MRFRRLALRLFVGLFTLTGFSTNVESSEPRRVQIAYFEGGAYPYHSRLRDEFMRQLNAVLPDSIEAVYSPNGFRTAEWQREKSKAMAKELAGVKDIDMVVAVGPWVINDLLDAGFKRPIVGMHQFAPQYEGLFDSNGKPKAKNLTLHTHRGKIKQDITRLTDFVQLKKLGVIYFPSSIESDSVLNELNAMGSEMGFEVVTAEGYANNGTFAIFNAFNKLDKRIDALYMPPMWGLDIKMINQLFYLTDVQKLPVMTSEDKFMVERGALLSNNAYGIYSEARFNAYKAAQIILGKTPNELPTEFSGGTSIAVNENTAAKCKIELSRALYLEAEVITETVEDESPPLTLTDAITRAVSFNPTVLAQKDAMEAAAQAASLAMTKYLPQVWASAGFGHRDDNYVNNSRNELKQDYFTSQLNLNQKIFSLETIRSIKLAGKIRNMQKISAEQVQHELELAVTRAYLNYLKALETIKVQKRIRELIERNIEISGTRFLAENGSEYDHSRWRTERDKSIQKLSNAEKNLSVARILLNTLLNYPASQKVVAPEDTFGARAVSITYERLSAFLNSNNRIERISNAFAAHAHQNNAGVKLQRQQLDIQKSILSVNKARFYPEFDLIASFHHNDELSDTPPPFKEEKNSWTIGGEISLPLFLGGHRFKEKNKLKAEYSRLEYERDAQLLRTTAKVHTAIKEIVASIEKLPVSARRVDRTRFNLELSVNGYDADEFDIWALIIDIEETTDAEFQEIYNRYRLYETMAELSYELGWTAYGSGTTFTQMIEDLVMQN